jgi:hypothetical protein
MDIHDIEYATGYAYPSYEKADRMLKYLNRIIDSVEKGYDGYYIHSQNVLISEVVMEESKSSVLLPVGEKIGIRGYSGTIVKRKYDPVTETMHYYTDIEYKITNLEEKEKIFKDAQEKALKHLRVLKENFLYPKEEEKEDKEENGIITFFKGIFGR